MQNLGSIVDFDDNVVHIRVTEIMVRPAHHIALAPGDAKIVPVIAKLLKVFNNLDITINLTGKMAKLGEHYALVKFNRNKAYVQFVNNTDETINLTPKYIIGHIDTRTILRPLAEINDYTYCEQPLTTSGQKKGSSRINRSKCNLPEGVTKRNAGQVPNSGINNPQKISRWGSVTPNVLNTMQNKSQYFRIAQKLAEDKLRDNDNYKHVPDESPYRENIRQRRIREFPFLEPDASKIT